ncbi:DUF6310 domain-containing protein [Hyalangium rubrum]|uniref:DUF6310 domain-containing protein n=1 Tax=Hyalangium rubrum TaxID=3103134 RepID=A0ABU5GV25_9BACT|nr:DUF6310 domain-containing protein [Hyalangium sp. s54d21]MDY7225021.1 DUF6310 domain-containing protein [Hyalangium sp. s54d21]
MARESVNEWPVLAERCYHALDRDRVKFRDITGRCAVASAGAAAVGVGLCIFAAPEIVVGAVIVVGVVGVAVVIKEELDAYQRNASRESGKPKPQAQPSNEQETVANRKPKPEGSPLGKDWLPPVFVNGKHFDALVLATRTLWEVKTDNFDIHSPRSQAFFAKVKLPEIQREKRLAEACGYNFAVGVRSAAHKAALLRLDPKLDIVVMDWC